MTKGKGTAAPAQPTTPAIYPDSLCKVILVSTYTTPSLFDGPAERRKQRPLRRRTRRMRRRTLAAAGAGGRWFAGMASWCLPSPLPLSTQASQISCSAVPLEPPSVLPATSVSGLSDHAQHAPVRRTADHGL